MAEDRMMRHENEVSEAVVLAAIAVHRALGPGLLESAYGPMSWWLRGWL